jgi:hypothetical protein
MYNTTSTGQCCASNSGAKIAYGSTSEICAYSTGAQMKASSYGTVKIDSAGLTLTGQSNSIKLGSDYIIRFTPYNANYTSNPFAIEMTNTGKLRPGKTNTATDNYMLGDSKYKWGQLYAVTASISTSDRNEKKDFDTDMSKYIDLLYKLKPTSYKLIEGTSGRTHVGFISQDVEEAMTECGLSAMDFAGFCKDADEMDGRELYSLRYDEFIAINTAAIQQLKAKVAELEAKLK